MPGKRDVLGFCARINETSAAVLRVALGWSLKEALNKLHEDEKVPTVLHWKLYKVCPMCRAEIPADGPLLNSAAQDVPEDTATLRNLWF